HYSMGGIRTNYQGKVQKLEGLFTAGEAACWDLHGFNRLGGNSVSEAVVSGMIIGGYFADYCAENQADINTAVIEKEIQKQDKYLDELLAMDGTEDIFVIKNRMKDIMDEKVGIFRTGKLLEEAVTELEELYKKSKNIKVHTKARYANPELDEAYRVPKMLKLALCVAKGALDRTESRGAHYREDYTKRDDANWMKRTLTQWINESDTMPTVTYEDLDIMTMEMPPAFRGYGAKGNIIENELSAKRQQEVDELKEKMEAEGKDRIEIQDALMSYNLQPKYKVRNERVGDQ
ncbi:MAG: FAD-binding protein, partial [Campylobacterales bacterium]|nr:FAD-binding protein [Campylobacterales bacterium]